MSKVPAHVYDKAVEAAILESLRRKPHQPSYANLVKTQLLTNANGDALTQYYTTIHGIYLGVASAIIPGSAMFPGVPNGIEGGVAVTTPNIAKKDLSFHIVQLVDHRVEGGPVVETAVRQMDNYCCAVRVLLPEDDPIMKEWFSLTGAELPQHLFRTVRPSGYPMAYKTIEDIRVSKGVLVKIYDHLVEFSNNPIATDEGKVLVDTLIFLIGEGQRFLFAQRLNIRYIRSNLPGRPSLMAELIRQWSDISDPILLLWLSMIMDEMGLITSARDLGIFGDQRLAAEVELLRFETKYSSLVKFRDQHGAFALQQLAGRSLFLIKYREEVMLKILMRLNGYRKIFLA